MLALTQAHPYQLLDFAAEVNEVESWPADAEPMGVINRETGEIICVVVYYSFTGTACEVSIAAAKRKHWASKRILKGLFAYPFIYKGLSRIFALVDESNVTALTTDLRLGFRFEGRIEDGGSDGGDAILIAMLAHRCPWTQGTPRVPEPPEEEDMPDG